jgi:hypothetical protein
MPSVVSTETETQANQFVQAVLSKLGRVPFQPAPGFVPTATWARGDFLESTSDGGPAYVDFIQEGQNTNMTTRGHMISVTDIRNYQPRTSIAVEGCEYVDFVPKLQEEDLLNPDTEWVKQKVEGEYWAECAELVKKHTGAIEVYPYHWLHRRTPSTAMINPFKEIRGKPITHFHIDNDAGTAEGNLRMRLGDEEAERWLKAKHWQIINIWKPIGDPASQYPLAMLDTSNLVWEKDVEVVHTRNNYKKNVNAVKYREGFNYYYVKNLRPDEALLFRDFDNREGGLIGIPHAAIDDTNSPKDGPLRRSIEVRCLVLYDDNE